MYRKSALQSISTAAGLSTLKISGYANNEIRLQLSTTPQSQKKQGDRAQAKKAEDRAKKLNRIEILRKWLAELVLGREPEIWIPQGGTGMYEARIYEDICEIDNRVYQQVFEKTKISPSEFESKIKTLIAEWMSENFSHLAGIEFTPVVKEVLKKWDKRITVDTEWIELDRDSKNLFYRAKPCFEEVTIPVSRVRKLPGTSIKVTWHKYTISKADCEKALKDATAALDITNRLQGMVELGTDNPQRGFTKRARHTLLEAGAITDKLAGKNAICVTLTLPGSTQESIRALAAYTSWFTNNLMQPIRDWRVKFDKKIEYFYVWEPQKRGALHIHICLMANPNQESLENLMKLGHKVKDSWYWLLKEMATTKPVKRFGKKGGVLPGIDMFARANARGKIKSWKNRPDKWEWDIQEVKKSVAAYFSKYAGKNAAPSSKKQFTRGSKVYCPSRWWGKSKGINEAIKANRFEYYVSVPNLQSSSLLEAVRQELELLPIVKAYSYPWQVLEHKYQETTIDGQKWYCKKGIVRGELEPVKPVKLMVPLSIQLIMALIIKGELLLVMLSRQEFNPSRILIQGHTEIYYFEPESFAEIWQFWKEQKGLLYDLSHKTVKQVESKLVV